MKNDKCSWCGKTVLPATGSLSNGKHYHIKCLLTRNAAGKTTRNEAHAAANLEYEPITHVEILNATEELLKSVNNNWKLAAQESRNRILAKYGKGINR